MEDASRDYQNPFTHFYHQVQALCQLNFVNSLQRGDPAHRLYRAVETLRRATVETASETDWHGPDAANTYSPYGSSPRTSFGGTGGHADYRPRTPNYGTSGLHPGPHYPSPPSTPNGDPLPNRRSYSQLYNQNAVYERKLEKCQDDLRAEKQAHQETTNALYDSREQVARLQSEATKLQKLNADAKQTIENAKKTMEDLHKEAATLCKEQKNYWDAAKHFSKLSDLKLDEAEAFDKCNDIEAANKAENSALNFLQQRGEMLGLEGEHADAETVFRRILSRREQLFGSDHIKRYKESRDTMLSLARALRKQRDDNKTMEAERLYERHASLIGIELRDEKSREWAFRNAIGLAGALYERQAYRHARHTLSLIWEDRSKVPASYASELDAEVLKILNLLRRRVDLGHTVHLIEALLVICKPDPSDVSSQLLPCYIELGKLLSEGTAISSLHNCQDQALSYLQDAWRCRDCLSVEQGRNTLWSIALIYASLGKWEKVKQQLDELRKFDHSFNYDDSSSTSTATITAGATVTDSICPDKAMVSALTARLQLNAGEFASAEATAEPLVILARDTNHNITAISTSNLLPPHTAFHQTDTLLKALTKRRKKEYFLKAKAIWDQVYAAVKRGEITDSDEIKMFAATGRSLADEWVEVRRNSVGRLVSPDDIRKKAKELEQRAAATAGNTSSEAV